MKGEGRPTETAGRLLLAALLVLCGCKGRRDTASTPSAAPGDKQYHNAYNGVDFSYPATWKLHKEERVLFEAEGANGCSLNIVEMEPVDHTTAQQVARDLQADAQRTNPDAAITERRTWAGAPKPGAGFQMVTIDKLGNRTIDYDAVFDHGEDTFMPTETMRDGDAACAAGLQLFEASLKLSKPDH